MNWYQVTKRINGRYYLYWQKTYRLNGNVKTLNKYIGPVAAKTPRWGSIASQMKDVPAHHKKLRKRYDAGKLSKVEYLEAITAKKPEPTRPFGLGKGLYFCKRCETQTDRVDWEGKCYACEPSEANRPSRPLPPSAGTFIHPQYGFAQLVKKDK